MKHRVIIFAAIALYAGILGCTVWSADSGNHDAASPTSATSNEAPAHSLADLPFRSVTMQLQRVDWMDKYKQNVDEIAALGADTVQFVIDTRQENAHTGRIYLDMRMTPTPDQLMDLIRHAKSKSLRVVMMPIVLLDAPEGEDWRGKINPPSWVSWFDSYRDMIGQFAWIAEGTHVDLLVVGSELISAEPHVDEWTRTIGAVRKVYHGKLTYSSNWDHYHSVQFWNQLDMIGMNSYWKLGDDKNAPIATIEKRWKEIQKDLIPFVKSQGKPLMFLEAGWCSIGNAASEPWDYTVEEQPLDLDLQKRLYQGFFNVWYGNPHLGGFSIWEWPPEEGGPDDRGYTPKGKPAEQVLKEYLAKPKWKVEG
ncbi:MAG: hypothetical protein JO353_11735 [Phycisphaerae bacterium]|nr:hypothetical protein [Phycisphaerae bacterium]